MYKKSLCNWKHLSSCTCTQHVSALNVALCISAEAPPHLPSLVERFDGQTIGTDVDDSSQLEPICRVGRPHRLSIVHFTAEGEKQENNHVNGRRTEKTLVCLWQKIKFLSLKVVIKTFYRAVESLNLIGLLMFFVCK